MKILCLSDTHGHNPLKNDPIISPALLRKTDLFLYAGDMTKVRDREDYSGQAIDFIEDFCSWFKHILDYCPAYFTWGNHETFVEHYDKFGNRFYLENNPYVAKHLLEDNSVISINSLKIYGTPYQPKFSYWAFNKEDNKEGLGKIYAKIPDDTDILLTHCPPYGIMDEAKDIHTDQIINAGSKQLRRRIDQLSYLKLHVFGHTHFDYGVKNIGDMVFVNASYCDVTYKPANEPILIEI